MDLRETLLLPKTEFSMKANLPEREPEWIRLWQDRDLYSEALRMRAGRDPFVVHDGPPYANGNIHMGTALNKVLKDAASRFHTMMGRPSPYVPGWDTHGMPIENLALREMEGDRHELDPLVVRRACRDFALRHIGAMTEQFRRLGVVGDWNHPYITMNPEYEAAELLVFGEMYERGLIYKGFRSVHWCPTCETALAEAEIEYGSHRSPSIYVSFPIVAAGGEMQELAGKAAVAIWTTTPWTLPANEAVALHPDLQYVLCESPFGPLVVAEAAVERLQGLIGLGKVLKKISARSLEGAHLRHPIFERDVPVVLGEHVTAEDGTGAVHTAPGHGAEDFQMGQEYGLPVTVPIDHQGRFTELGGPFQGLRYDEANPRVIEYVMASGRLLHAGEIEHQYPHCWRCHGIVVFRATEQWFGSVDAIRDEILQAIGEVTWTPGWGELRMRQMTQDRSDWCISRQRVWGVPIPAFYCSSCDAVLVTPQTVEKVSEAVREHGADVWWERSAKELLPPGQTCPACGGEEFRKETDILDVWFDSGSSHAAVLRQRPEMKWPADLYLEGPDQFRGYFNSSLTTSVATQGRAPYLQVVCHGFVVDGEGRKMSKSLGNGIAPEEVVAASGADVLRLWATSADFTADIHISKEILSGVSEGYRKIRNTWRFLLGNLAGFDPSKDLVPLGALTGLEGYMRGRLGELVETVAEAYRSYALQGVYQAVLNFSAVDLSSLYLDVRKDLLYCGDRNGADARAARTLIWHAASVTARLMAPILCFTSEEVWHHLPNLAEEPWSVHLADFPVASEYALDEDLQQDYRRLLSLRDEVLKSLEQARAEKRIGKSTDAAVRLTLPLGPEFDVAKGRRLELEELTIVSLLDVTEGQRGAAIDVCSEPRCDRCWLHRDDVVDGLCGRCRSVVAG